MPRALQVGAIFILTVACAAAQKENVRKPAPAPAPRSGGGAKGFPKAPLKQPGASPRPNNPAYQFERLISMPPEQRDRVIEKLPPQQQERLRNRLDQFDRLPPAQKAWRIELMNRLFALPPERQQAYTEQVQAFNKLEPRHRRVIADEIHALWALPEADRQAKLANEAYRSRFTPEELQILSTISAANILK
jgi:hypothetical protein